MRGGKHLVRIIKEINFQITVQIVQKSQSKCPSARAYIQGTKLGLAFVDMVLVDSVMHK